VKIGGHLTPTLFELSCNQLKLGAMSSILSFPVPIKLHIIRVCQHLPLSLSQAQRDVENGRIRETELRIIIKLKIICRRMY